jgi:predicted nucleotidyltransferase component of viral defense system
MFIGTQGRFSTDLDFTGTEEHDHEEVILGMMGAFATFTAASSWPVGPW